MEPAAAPAAVALCAGTAAALTPHAAPAQTAQQEDPTPPPAELGALPF
jgi:hypothetical protein